MADNSLAGGGKGIGIDEAAELGIVITGLEVIEPGVVGIDVAMRAKRGGFRPQEMVQKTGQ